MGQVHKGKGFKTLKVCIGVILSWWIQNPTAAGNPQTIAMSTEKESSRKYDDTMSHKQQQGPQASEMSSLHSRFCCSWEVGMVATDIGLP